LGGKKASFFIRVVGGGYFDNPDCYRDSTPTTACYLPNTRHGGKNEIYPDKVSGFLSGNVEKNRRPRKDESINEIFFFLFMWSVEENTDHGVLFTEHLPRRRYIVI
jgi:hypothetical protein